MGKILSKVVSKKRSGEMRKKKNEKSHYKLVENLMSGDFKSSEFEQIVEEVASIVYSHICQLSKIYQNDSQTFKRAGFNG